MTDYQKYINALRKCANEHENDKTFTGHIIVSDLCRDTANLLETIEKKSTTNNGISNRSIIYKAKESKEIQEDLDKLSKLNDPTTKNNLAHNLCDLCANIGCEFQSGIVRTECAFYMPPQLEPDNCGNYVVQDTTTKNDLSSELDKNSKKLEKNFGESDCVSRQAVLELIADYDLSMGQVVRGIHALPPVTPIRPKRHWKYFRNEKGDWMNVCSNCNSDCGVGYPYDYCPNCGAKMESEDNNTSCQG